MSNSVGRKRSAVSSWQSAEILFSCLLPPAFCLLLTVFAGCIAYKPFPFSKPAAVPALPAQYQHYYDYPVPDLKVTVLYEKHEKGHLLRGVEFPLNLPEDLQVKDLETRKKTDDELFLTDKKTALDNRLRYTNRIDYYLPENLKPGEKRPAILISPILGGNMVVDRFAAYYTGRGYIAAIVHRKRLYWSAEKRTDPSSGGEDDKDIYQVEDYMRASVIRLRQAVDWLEAQPEVDSSRIGAFGVSYGAILHTILAAVEPRIRYHVLAMPAAPLADVILTCPEKQIVKLKKKVHETYGWTDEEIRQKLSETLISDPILLAPYVPKKNVQVYIALFDRVVGTGRSFRLWKALGKPDLKLIPFGHYGGVVVFPLLETQSYWAFRRHLENSEQSAAGSRQ